MSELPPADDTELTELDEAPARFFRHVPKTGVIYVTDEARRRGYKPGATDWANLGQGQPETGPLPGAPAHEASVALGPLDHEYAPTAGLPELREAVARLYNELFREGKRSLYTAENVCISGGGRMALARAAAALGPIHLGHFLPDYTAYEELLELFKLFSAIPVALEPHRAYRFSVDELRDKVLDLGLGAVLLSNPGNPTGKLIYGEELRGFLKVARELRSALLIDEYYSHYIWNEWARGRHDMVSAAQYVEEVDEDDVLIFDGLTKNWRRPGWRIGWIVGPKRRIEAIASVASFLDGGASRPMQRAALPLLTRERALEETRAIQRAFAPKRELMVERLRAMGVVVDREPDGTFYVWGAVNALPRPIAGGFRFFRAALEKKVIVVPGQFFDVNPGKRRPGRLSRYGAYVRFSFGPPIDEVERGLGALEAMVRALE
jgi:hypothetical protein